MNKTSGLSLLIAVAALAAVFTFRGPQFTDTRKEETAYDRVMRTGTLRCGYGAWDPIIIKDPNTGKLSGIFYDYMEELGKELSLKIVWDSSLNWSDWTVGLKQGRYDAACVGIWPMAQRSRESDFTIPIYYHAMYAYVRINDTRFDGNLEAANNEEITFAGQDGTVPQQLVQKRFPKAKLLSLSDMNGQTDSLLYVANKKADIVISDKVTAESFIEHNPGKLRQVQQIEPIAYYGNTIGVKVGEDSLRRLLDNATRDLLNTGVVDKILAKYEKYPGSFMRVAKPYQP